MGWASLVRSLTIALGAAALAGCASLPDVTPADRASSLHVECRGVRNGAPTAVLEAGAFGTSADWDRVQTDLSQFGRVCAYDRAGLGASQARKGRPGIIAMVANLGDALDQMGETGPVILVGHSNGALYVEAFARLQPQRVAGLAYVNGVGSDALDSAELRAALRDERRLADIAPLAWQLGVIGLIADRFVEAVGLEGAAARRKAEAWRSPGHLLAAREEEHELLPALEAVRKLPPLDPAIPIAVIVAEPSMDDPVARAWRGAEVAAAAHACRAWMLDALGGTHVSPLGRDRAYVVSAVRWLQAQPRTADPAMCTAR